MAGVAVTGTATLAYTRRAHPSAASQSTRRIEARREYCIAWCECGWRSQTQKSRTEARRELHIHTITRHGLESS
jgi:hypothetical protein